jgi:hypothetical protein
MMRIVKSKEENRRLIIKDVPGYGDMEIAVNYFGTGVKAAVAFDRHVMPFLLSVGNAVDALVEVEAQLDEVGHKAKKALDKIH